MIFASYPYAGTIRIRFKGFIRRCLRLAPPLRKKHLLYAGEMVSLRESNTNSMAVFK